MKITWQDIMTHARYAITGCVCILILLFLIAFFVKFVALLIVILVLAACWSLGAAILSPCKYPPPL